MPMLFFEYIAQSFQCLYCYFEQAVVVGILVGTLLMHEYLVASYSLSWNDLYKTNKNFVLVFVSITLCCKIKWL